MIVEPQALSVHHPRVAGALELQKVVERILQYIRGVFLSQALEPCREVLEERDFA